MEIYPPNMPNQHVTARRDVINPRHACTGKGYSSCLVCLYVCLSVCLSTHVILAVHAIKSIMKDIVLSIKFAAILKRCFSLNCFIRKLEHFYLPRQGWPSLVDAYSAWNVLYTLCYMFAYA